MRESVPLPMESRYATLSLIPWTSRNGSASAPGTTPACQCLPPSVVTTNVPPLPLAHTTFEFTGLRPIRDAVVPLLCGVNVGPVCVNASVARRIVAVSTTVRGKFMSYQPLSECLHEEPEVYSCRKQSWSAPNFFLRARR